MLGFAQNIVFVRANGGSLAEKSWLARATGLGVVPSAWNVAETARTVELRVPGDFFSSEVDTVLLWFACVETLCALELLHQSDVFYSSVLQFYCLFQVRVCRSQWNGCIKVSRKLLGLQ